MDKTVLIWTKDDSLKERVRTAVEKLGLRLVTAECDADIIGIPCFYVILDSSKLNAPLTEYLNKMARVMADYEQTILIVGTNRHRIPNPLKNFVVKLDEVPDSLFLEKSIEKAHDNCPAVMRQNMNNTFAYTQFDRTKKRIFRVWYLHKELTKKGGYANTKVFANIFNVSEKTILRDIKILKDFSCEIYYDGWAQNKGFYMRESFK
ncbi:MAG: HTH domain-containing protein [Bacteroidota bacterium]